MRKMFSVLILIAIYFLIFSNQTFASVTKGKPVNYSVEIKDVFTNDQSQTVTDTVITEILKGKEDNSHLYAILTKRNLLIQPSSVTVDEKGNQIATFKIALLKPGESIAIGEKLFFQGSPTNYKLTSTRVKTDYSGINFASLYLLPSYHIESDNPIIIATTRKVVGNETNPLSKAHKIYGFVNSYINYDNREFKNQGALYALQNARGVCYEYSTLMVALLRNSGVPARMVEGYKVEPKELNQMARLADGRIDLSGAAHAWVEFYLPGVGWVPSEPTIYYTLNGRQQISWDYFTNIDSPLYIPVSTDIRMESKWSGRGHLEVKRTEALEVNPADFSAPPVEPNILPSQVNEQVKQVSMNINQLNIDSAIKWLNNKLLPYVDEMLSQKKTLFVFLAILFLIFIKLII